MDKELPFEPDDFDDIPPGLQLSGQMVPPDVSQLSQGAWYDLEDEQQKNRREEDVTPQSTGIARASGSSVKLQQASNPVNPSPMRRNKQPSRAPYLSKWMSLPGLLVIGTSVVVIAIVLLTANHLLEASMYRQNSNSRVTSSSPSPVARSLPSPTPKATPTQKPATPTPTATPVNTVNGTVLPPGWTASGHTAIDAMEGMNAAEAFVQRYKTYDYRSPATLTSSLFILTKAAQSRFQANDKRATTAFAQQISQEQLVQVTTVTGTQVVQDQQQNGYFFAWVNVLFQMTIQKGQSTLTATQGSMTVLLVGTQFAATPGVTPPMGGIGWLVSDYQDGNTLPAIPANP